jgi:hypothetical protein
MNAKQMVTGVVCVAVALSAAACGKKSSDPAEDLGTSLGNALVLGMAKDQYAKAKQAYDSGQDATTECIMSTAELRKDKSAEAQKLADDIDRLCEVDAPAKALGKRLDDALASVTGARTDKSKSGTLASEQVLLKMACDDADERIKQIGKLGLSSQPNAAALQSKRNAACTTDNLTGGPLKQARATRK